MGKLCGVTSLLLLPTIPPKGQGSCSTYTRLNQQNCHYPITCDLQKWPFRVLQQNVNSKCCWLRTAGQGKGSVDYMALPPYPPPQRSFRSSRGNPLGAETQILPVGWERTEQSWWAMTGALTAHTALTRRTGIQSGFKPRVSVSVAHVCSPHTASTQFLRLYHFPELQSPMLRF